jgi:hypothetical protein
MALVRHIRGTDIQKIDSPSPPVAMQLARRCQSGRMNTTNPYMALDPVELANQCSQRVGRLRAKDWSTPAERDLLREDTVLLLDAVAQQLGPDGSSESAVAISLGDLVNSIEHGPLASGRRDRSR